MCHIFIRFTFLFFFSVSGGKNSHKLCTSGQRQSMMFFFKIAYNKYLSSPSFFSDKLSVLSNIIQKMN